GGLVTKEEAEIIRRDARAAKEKLEAKKPEGADVGFLYAALLAALRVSPGSRRNEIIERFRGIQNLSDARTFLGSARAALAAHDLFHPTRKRWRPATKRTVPQAQ